MNSKKIMFVMMGALVLSPPGVAGEWFKTIELKGGIGLEIESECRLIECDKYNIGEPPIGNVSVTQSIYSSGEMSVSLDYIHLSSLPGSGDKLLEDGGETPVDYIGLSISVSTDWY